MNPALTDYIKRKRDIGLDDESIRKFLLEQGWQADEVDKALTLSPENDAPPPPSAIISPVAATPVPAPQAMASVKVNSGTHGLEYMIMGFSLWIAATSLGSLLHYLATLLLDPTSEGLELYSFINPFSSAALFVSLPIFTFLFFRTHRSEESHPEWREGGLRKFSAYAILVIVFLTAVGRFITSIFVLMSGGLFGLASNPLLELIHISITLAITVPIFVHFWKQTRKPDHS